MSSDAPHGADRGLNRGPFAAHDERLAPMTVVDPALVRVADLAVRLLGAGSAQVTMVLDEQTVVGGTAGPEGASRAAAATVCEVLGAAVMRTGTSMLVDDVAADPRVRAQAPGSTGAYIGVALMSGGHAIGTFSVLDVDPRHWTPQDLAVLETLAAPVLAERELAALETAYEGDRLLWELAVDAAGVGVFDWDMRTGELRWDDRLLTLFGISREDFGGTIEAFNQCLHPEDVERVGQALEVAIGACGDFAAEYRVVWPDGTVRWVAARGRALAGPGGGEATRVLGAAYDTTAVQEGEARLARVLEAMSSGFMILDHEWRMTHINSEAKRILGVIGEPSGQVFWEAFPATVGKITETEFLRAAQTGEQVSFETYAVGLDGWYEIRAWPTPEGLSVFFSDVTERRQAQETVRLGARRNELVADVTSALSETLEVADAATRLAKLLVPSLGDWCMVSLAEAEPTGLGAMSLTEVASWHADPARREMAARYTELRRSSVNDSSLREVALAGSKPIVISEGLQDLVAAAIQPGEAADLVTALDAECSVLVPLRGRGRTTGLVTVIRDRGKPVFTESEVDLLVDLAGRAGLAIDNLRAFGEQRALAEGLQRSLLTAPPALEGLDVAVRYEPAARAAQVGGDWYDAFELPGCVLTLVIGDVVGHDTAAAAAMGQLRGLVRGIGVTTAEGPSALLSRVDAAIEALRVETTATAVVAQVECGVTDTGCDATVARVTWSTAGHPPPLLAVRLPGTDEVEVRELWTPQPDLLLGLDPSTVRTEDVADLPPGATVLLYTDGLVERRDESIDDGMARLVATLGELVAEGLDLEALCDQLLARMLPGRPDDDVALIAVRSSAAPDSR